MKKFAYALMLSAAIAACTPVPKEAYFNHGEPESLLDISTEVVNVGLTSQASVEKVIAVINKEQPTRAQVSCRDGDPLCRQVKSVMKQFKVPVQYHTAKASTVAIIYERVMARNCQNRYIDNAPNLDNLNSPTLGCSVAINTVQLVTDKHQFTDPALMGDPDAVKPLQAMTNYNTVTKPDTTFPLMVEGTNGSSR